MEKESYQEKKKRMSEIGKIIAQFCIKIEPFASLDDNSNENIQSLVDLGIKIIKEDLEKISINDGVSSVLWESIKHEQKKMQKADQFFSVIDYLKEINRDDLIKELLIEN